MLYGDSTFTGRAIIWDFANYEIARRPLLGWGYQSFWLAGPGAPSIVDAPGWVKVMPNAHNGYKDTMLEMGYVGFALLIAFIIATLHAIGRVADRDSARAWAVLSLALFVIIYNGLESTWMRGFEFLWVVFLILAVEIARYWQPFHPAVRSLRGHRFSPDHRRPRARPTFSRRPQPNADDRLSSERSSTGGDGRRLSAIRTTRHAHAPGRVLPQRGRPDGLA